jgi:hypothetical protein
MYQQQDDVMSEPYEDEELAATPPELTGLPHGGSGGGGHGGLGCL